MDTKYTFIAIYNDSLGQSEKLASVKYHCTAEYFLNHFLGKFMDYDSASIYFDDSTDIRIAAFRDGEEIAFYTAHIDRDDNPLGIERKFKSL